MKTLKVLLVAILLMAFTSPANACGDCEPDTELEIKANGSDGPITVCVGEDVMLTVCERNLGDYDLYNVAVAVYEDDGSGPLSLTTLVAPPDRGDFAPLGVLNIGEEWCWDYMVIPVSEATVYTALAYGELEDGRAVICSDIPDPPPDAFLDDDECDDVVVETTPCYPDTKIDIKANDSDGPITVCEGEKVTLTICEQNTGQVDLTAVQVVINDGSADIATLTAPPDSGDISDPGVLNVGETWCWDVVVIVNATTTYTATGYGTDPAGNVITYPDYQDEQDDVTVETGPCEGEGCRVTGGGVNAEDLDGNRATFGGQAGANTALPPQPKGEWTHTQKKGPSGSFTFHGGTASSPAGSEIIEIRCSDPGTCKPSGDPPSPAKQIDFDGVGTFKNFGSNKESAPVWLFPGATAKADSKGGKFKFNGTFHYFQVNNDDLGEPGNKNLDAKSDPDTCPPNGFGEKGDLPLGDCQCADFYRITIYDGVDAADVDRLPDGSINLNSLNTVDVIYEFHGYIDGGNLQIHHLTGYDMNLSDKGLVSLNELAANWLEGI